MKWKDKKIQLLMSIFSLSFFIGTGVWLFLRWEYISYRIVTHYNFIGIADKWGPKIGLLVIFAIGLVLYAFITYMFYFANRKNNVNTEKNSEKQRKMKIIIGNMAEILKLIISAFFSYLTIMSALNYNLYPTTTMIFLLGIFSTIIIAVAKCLRLEAQI